MPERESERGARRAWQAPARSSQHATRKRGLPAEANVLISGQTERRGRAGASLTDGRRTIAVIVHGGRADSPRPAGQPRRLSIRAKKASRALREEGRARIRLSVSLSWRPAIPVRRSVCLSCANVDIKIDNEWTPVRPGGSQPTERVHVLSLRSSPLGNLAVPGTMECGEQIGWRALGRKDGECQQPSESVRHIWPTGNGLR